jgi:hypothetical protein
LPAAVRGPVLFKALRRLAAIWAAVAMVFPVDRKHWSTPGSFSPSELLDPIPVERRLTRKAENDIVIP